MPTATFAYHSEAERAAIEQAIAFVAEMHQLAQAAPDGHALDLCEARALDQGRQLRRDTLQAAAQARAAHVEKKGGPHAPAAAADATASSALAAAT